MILDATYVPDDIPCPVDLRLLDEAREATEKIIDKLFEQVECNIHRKPRCNLDKAPNHFLMIIKTTRPKQEEIREAKRFRLNETERNLKAIAGMIALAQAFWALGHSFAAHH